MGIADDITKIKDLEEEALKNRMDKEMARLQGLSLIGRWPLVSVMKSGTR